MGLNWQVHQRSRGGLGGGRLGCGLRGNLRSGRRGGRLGGSGRLSTADRAGDEDTAGDALRSLGGLSRSSRSLSTTGGSGSRGVSTAATHTKFAVLGVFGTSKYACCSVQLLNVRSRVRELKVSTVRGLAGVAAAENIGLEHFGERVQEILGATRAGDRQGSTVHVHLTVANLVEPSPGKSVVTSRQLLGDGEVICVRVDGVSVVTHVAGLVLCRAATLDGLDNSPYRVLVGLGVGSHRNLARTAAVNSTSNEGELLSAALSIHVAGTLEVVDTSSLFAGEIGAVRKKRSVGQS